MKNLYKIFFVGCAVAGVFSSCKQYDIDPIYHDSAILDMKATKINILDASISTGIDFVSTSETVSDVDVYIGDNELWTGKAVDNKVEFSLTRESIGLEGDDMSATARVFVDAIVDGRVKEMYTTFSLVSLSEISGLTQLDDVDEDGEEIKVDDFLYYGSTKEKNVEFSVESDLDINIVTEMKVGANSEFATYYEGAFLKDDAKFSVTATDYAKTDTLFFRVIASTTAGKDTTKYELTLVDEQIALDGVATVTAKNMDDAEALNIVTGQVEDINTAGVFVKFTHDFAALTQGIEGQNISFYVPEQDEAVVSSIIDMNTMLEGKTLVSSVPDLNANDVVYYSYNVDDKDAGKVYTFVGRLEVGSINTNRDEQSDFIEFTYGTSEVDFNK